MMLIDSHLHIEKGLDNYDVSIEKSNIIFNSLDSYAKFAPLYPDHFHSVIFDINTELSFYRNLIARNKISCLKIHSRIQKISDSDYSNLIEALKKLNSHIPVIYDAFYFGHNLQYQPSLLNLIKMIKIFPQRKFIIAHSGGYEILKYFFHLRNFSNVFYDLSFSLQYLADSSCHMDLVKLIKYTDKRKLLFGTDYPFASPALQLSLLKDIMDKLYLAEEDRQAILYNNALELFSNEDSI